MPRKKRITFQKKDIYILISIIAVSFTIIVCKPLLISKRGNTAVVTVDGKIVEKLNLEDYTKKTDISLEKYGVNIILRLENSEIMFLSSDCRDRICVNSGKLKNETDMAVCLPNKTSVVLYTAEEAKKLK